MEFNYTQEFINLIDTLFVIIQHVSELAKWCGLLDPCNLTHKHKMSLCLCPLAIHPMTHIFLNRHYISLVETNSTPNKLKPKATLDLLLASVT